MNFDTPINVYKINRKYKKDWDSLVKMTGNKSVRKICLTDDFYWAIFESISPTVRDNYRDEMRFNGKMLVRR